MSVEDKFREWEQNRNSYLEHRESSIAKINELANDASKMLKKFSIDEGEELIEIESFMHVEIGEPFYINDKIYFIRQHSNEIGVIVFLTYVKAGGKFGKQKHDVLEICKVLQGNLVEEMQDNREIKAGESITYQIMETHKPTATLDSIYEVKFYLDEDGNLTPAET